MTEFLTKGVNSMFLSNNYDDIKALLRDTLPQPSPKKLLIKLYAQEQPVASPAEAEFSQERQLSETLMGMVLALGEGCYSYYKDWIIPKTGQWIIFHPYSHVRFYCKGVPLCFVDDSDVLVIVSDPYLVTPVRRIR